MSREAIAVVVGGFLTAVAVTLVLGPFIYEGPVVVVFSPSHGLHKGDFFVLGVWALLIGALWTALRLWPRR